MSDKLHDVPGTQALLGGVSRTTVFELIRTGRLRSVKVGRRRMVPASQIDAYISRELATQGAPAPGD